MLVRFAGLGSEINDFHYAIVWNVHRRRDHIVVIPCTSFKDESTVETETTFNIGQVGFLESQTVIMMDQITTISRKWISKTKHKAGPKGPSQYVSLVQPQMERINEGFRVLGLGEKILYHEIRDDVKRLPLFANHAEQYSHLHRPIRPSPPPTYAPSSADKDPINGCKKLRHTSLSTYFFLLYLIDLVRPKTQ
nr:type II toxin-antitoxin system PemK/MazF family toxin [Melghirimyces profundicolus]